MLKLSINVERIPKGSTTPGKNGAGRYLELVCFDKPDNYGNDGFVAIGVTKEEREAGKRGPIVGNWKTLGGAKTPASKAPPPKRQADPSPDLDAADGDDIPF
jgi:hypothetical protein